MESLEEQVGAVRQLRILHIIAHMEKGGAERQMLLLTRASIHAHHIAVLAGNERPSETPVVVLDDLRFWKNVRRVRDAIRAHKIDIVQTWVPERLTFPATLAARLERKPVIAGDRRKPRSYGRFWVRDRLYYLAYLASDMVVPNYPILPKPLSLARILGLRRKTEVIPNGFEIPDRVQPLSTIPRRILFVGRLVEQKRVPLVLEALPRLAELGVTGIDIIGEGPEKTRLEGLAEGQDVRFHGARFDWQTVFDPSEHFIVLPSTSEGMSNTAFEAIAHGFLPVLSDSPELRASLASFPEKPWFFDLASPHSLTAAIGALRGMDLAALEARRGALRDGIRHYSIPVMARAYDRLYERVSRD